MLVLLTVPRGTPKYLDFSRPLARFFSHTRSLTRMKRARDLGGLLAKSKRRDGVAMFARELERRFGRIEDLFEEPSVDVITRSSLTQADLAELFAHRACAVHVPGFYPAKAAASVATRLLGQSTQNWKVSSPRGLESSDVLSIGKPYNVAAQEGPEAIEGELRRKRQGLSSESWT